jgi:hypothetical protein
MSEKHILHQVNADCACCVAQVGRTLEVRDRETHAVLQVIEPPKEWADNWLWSSCEFDGSTCVSVDCIHLLRTSPNGASARAAACSHNALKPRPELSRNKAINTTGQLAAAEHDGCAGRSPRYASPRQA